MDRIWGPSARERPSGLPLSTTSGVVWPPPRPGRITRPWKGETRGYQQVSREHVVKVTFSDEELLRLDEVRPPGTSAAGVRAVAAEGAEGRRGGDEGGGVGPDAAGAGWPGCGDDRSGAGAEARAACGRRARRDPGSEVSALLPQPHGFEGLVLVGVAREAPDLAVAELKDMKEAHLARHATSPSRSRDPDGHQHELARVDEPLRVNPKVLGGFEHPFDPRSQLR